MDSGSGCRFLHLSVALGILLKVAPVMRKGVALRPGLSVSVVNLNPKITGLAL